MSAFVVEEETMQRCVFAIAQNMPVFEGHNTETREGCTDIGAALYRMNGDAVEDRYDNRYHMTDNAKQAADLFRFYPDYGAMATPAQLLKSLACLRYQCSEGDVPETALYKALDALIEKLDAGGLSKTAVYKAAKWG